MFVFVKFSCDIARISVFFYFYWAIRTRLALFFAPVYFFCNARVLIGESLL